MESIEPKEWTLPWCLSLRKQASYKKKTGNIIISENLSGDVPKADLTSNHFIEGMRKIYELQPFIISDSQMPHLEKEGVERRIAAF